MNINELPGISGSVTRTLRDKFGNIISQETDHNLIVDIGKDFWLRVLAGDASGKLNYCIVGDGGALDSDPFNPISPISSQKGLTGPHFFSKAIASHTPFNTTRPLVPLNSVTFSTTFTSQEVNLKISEAGLFYNIADADSVNSYCMFARHTFPTTDLRSSETNSFSFEIAWTIYFN